MIIRTHTDLSGSASSALFSPCERYRYRLERRWAPGPLMCWVMLNPSTADEMQNDPTVERCERRARAGGFGGLVVVNLFALRSTDPAGLRLVEDPVGPGNDEQIVAAAREACVVVCGWGTDGALQGRGKAVLALLESAAVVPHALRLTKGGHPGHPLYVSYSAKPFRMEVA